MDVRLPNLGEGADSGSVVSIAVKEGDSIKKGQTILELENEKAVAPIPSPADGKVVSIRVKPGDKISVGQVLLTLAGSGETAEKAEASSTSAARRAPETSAKAPEPEAEPEEEIAEEEVESNDERAFPPPASPSVRKIARDLGIDLHRVKGSEHGGRIILADLRAYIERLQRLAFAPKTKGKAAPAPAAPESIDFSKWGAVSKKPLSPLRKTISQRMVESWTTIPHVTQFDETDITELNEMRKKYAPAYEQKGARLTLTSFALKAVVAALKKNPIFNSSLDEAAQELVLKEYFHIGVAVDTEAGLIVPVIRDVDRKNLWQLSKELHDLAGKARDRKVSLDELKGGSFTISNQGGIGGAHFTPIVNKPEVAILGLGRGAVKPMVKNGKIEPRLLMPICLSYDHRIIDGGQAARFVVDLREAFEQFAESEVKL
jgi:pyruvate dehydrogenase E2 component (dihydrolipoamide acetyltransferase)